MLMPSFASALWPLTGGARRSIGANEPLDQG